MKIIVFFLIWACGVLAFSFAGASGPPTLDANETTPVPQPVPQPKPKPPPPPPPPPPKNHVTDAMVYETKVYALAGTQYQRFGHSIAAFGTSVAVGSLKESIAPSVSVFSVQVSTSATSSLSRTASSYSDSDINYSHSNFVNVTWTEEAEYSAPTISDIDYYDGYGQSVAMNAQSLVVGAPYTNVPTFATGGTAASSGYSVGTAHVFSVGSGTAQSLSPSTVYTNMQFAAALSLQNATLAVGAPGASATGQMSGAVYLFQYDSDASEWTEIAELVDEDGGAAYAKFGSSVCLSNDATLLAVGASGYSKHVIHGGAVFLFQKRVNIMSSNTASVDSNTPHNSTGNSTEPEQPAEQVKYTWDLQSVLVPGSLAAYAYFGQSVAFRDRIGLVSALDESGSGVVYLYQQQITTESHKTLTGFLRSSPASNSYPAATWVLTSILTPTSASPANRFGASLAIFHTGDAYSRYTDESGAVELQEAYVLAVGAPGDSVGSVVGNSAAVDYAGAVYLYLGPHGSGNSARRTTSSVKLCCGSLHTGVLSTSSAGDEFALMTKVLANDSTAYDNYGSSLALMGAHLLVGAELADTSTAARSGAVYLETNLIPYLVAATQQAEQGGQEPSDDDDGDGNEGNDENDGGGDGDASGTEQKSGWAAFLAFIGTSGGVVTMSFLPLAVLAIVFVAHARVKGKKLTLHLSKASCCAPARGGSGDEPPANVGAHASGAKPVGSVSQEPLVPEPLPIAATSASQSKVTKRSPSIAPKSTPAASTVHYVLQTQQEASLDSIDLEQHLQPPEISTDTTPTFWQRMWYYASHPWMLRSAGMHTKVPSDAGAGADAVSPPSSQATRNVPSPASAGKDLRLRTATPKLSIRSPITHIPLHSSMVMSPHHNTDVSVQSYRFTITASTIAATDGNSATANLAPDTNQRTGLLGQNSELRRLKERLNAEFTTQATTPPSPLAGPRSAVEPERVTLLTGGSSPGAQAPTEGASSAPKPTSAATAAPATSAVGNSKKGKIAATIRV